jgi:hypothetical protein
MFFLECVTLTLSSNRATGLLGWAPTLSQYDILLAFHSILFSRSGLLSDIPEVKTRSDVEADDLDKRVDEAALVGLGMGSYSPSFSIGRASLEALSRIATK